MYEMIWDPVEKEKSVYAQEKEWTEKVKTSANNYETMGQIAMWRATLAESFALSSYEAQQS